MRMFVEGNFVQNKYEKHDISSESDPMEVNPMTGDTVDPDFPGPPVQA